MHSKVNVMNQHASKGLAGLPVEGNLEPENLNAGQYEHWPPAVA